MKKYDITVLGELLIDMTYAGKSQGGRTLFEQNPGGAVANVVAAVQRLGGKGAFIGKIGDDMHGEYLRETLDAEGICTRGLITDDKFFTTLAFVNLDKNGDRSFSFARKPGADTQLSKEEVDFELVEESKIFHIGSLSVTDEPARGATFAALEFAKEKGLLISYDPNYRAPLWKDEETAINGMKSILKYVDIIKISDEETKLLTGVEGEIEASEELIKLGIKNVIVTMGAKGALIRNKEGYIYTKAHDVPVVDTTGAGDSFMGGFLYKVAQSGNENGEFTLAEIQEFADFASCVSAKCVQSRGGISSMPYINEL